ncbi:MAG: glycosyltransferase family 4 protein [Actinomycetota bacterium]
MRVSLVTLGDPGTQTGGYLYHRRLAGAAPRHGADFGFVSFPGRPFPLPAASGRDVLTAVSAADVVVVDSIAAAYAGPWLGRARRPVVGMLHQGPGGIDHGPLRTRLQARLDRLAYRHMRVLLVASDALAEDLRDLHHDVRVIAPGRDVAAAPDPAVSDLRRGRAAAFLCVGNWVPRKGIVELLDAFAQLDDRAATLHLVGDDHVQARYARRVRRRISTVADRVVVHGVVPKERVAALYRDADVFVMPSLKEPYGTAYAEAMAAGLPVVGWRAGNLPHLARHEHEGLVVDPHDVAGLAAALRRLSQDVELRSRLGNAARERAQTFPTWEETATAFFGALRSASGSWPPDRR